MQPYFEQGVAHPDYVLLLSCELATPTDHGMGLAGFQPQESLLCPSLNYSLKLAITRPIQYIFKPLNFIYDVFWLNSGLDIQITISHIIILRS